MFLLLGKKPWNKKMGSTELEFCYSQTRTLIRTQTMRRTHRIPMSSFWGSFLCHTLPPPDLLHLDLQVIVRWVLRLETTGGKEGGRREGGGREEGGREKRGEGESDTCSYWMQNIKLSVQGYTIIVTSQEDKRTLFSAYNYIYSPWQDNHKSV